MGSLTTGSPSGRLLEEEVADIPSSWLNVQSGHRNPSYHRCHHGQQGERCSTGTADTEKVFAGTFGVSDAGRNIDRALADYSGCVFDLFYTMPMLGLGPNFGDRSLLIHVFDVGMPCRVHAHVGVLCGDSWGRIVGINPRGLIVSH